MHANRCFRSSVMVLALGVATGCAHTIPRELSAARTAYDRSSHGEAARRAPAELHKAAMALSLAERAYKDEPGGQVSRDYAYVALRKIQLADVIAVRRAHAEIQKTADDSWKQAQAAKQRETSEALSQAQIQLNSAQQGALAADAKNKEMAERLSQLANVREDARGTVVTLSGSLLFPSNKATLSSSAQARLDEVSKALMTEQERTILVEGYTDSRGSENSNRALSQRRAEAVRRYLVQRGYEADRVQAEGKGEAEPVASNDDPEGRANNRRVEIIVERGK